MVEVSELQPVEEKEEKKVEKVDLRKERRKIALESLNNGFNNIRKHKPKIIDEFREFLEEYKVLGLAIAVIMGLASNALVKALVDNIIMPIITPFIPGGGWQTATAKIGPIVIGWGAFLSSLIYFLILAWAVFLIVRYVLGKKKVAETK